MLTGLGIVASGFISLGKTLLSIHWKMTVYLALFSCVTHLLSLTVLRRYFQKRSWARYSRLAFMLVLLLMLIVAMVPTAFFNWERGVKLKGSNSAADLNDPAICFFSISCGIGLYQAQYPVIPFTQTSAFVEMLIS
ncbi:uncharacterized protein BDZ83DRAFT_161095 [Colletotrichum acutatum]|uniref:Uncharacterized protein n=1 Tax=Glomerella acutata TaxID=27357 RepID=A0AAD8XQC9_GLOAC|nr:uncharacterized protein BDZ83DRAFT_161095 [Colletotrichum acutatum]KAK1731489.1 hypothetical protein BDZ83DRAFT_161095 [Colletotrichum acutatum]